jgi:hypothetical protein
MTFTLATRTLDAIDEQIESDQGASFRQHLQKVLPHIGDAYRGIETNPFRTHLGASVIGGECARAIWYGFRWATKPHFGGRILRLFNRGHLEEGRFIAALLCIGVQVFQQDENGKQFRISELGGHFGGSGDGVAIGIPDVPAGTPVLLEFKTHNAASFKKLKSEGVRGAKFEHYVQMQTYMRKMGLMYALYGAVCKDTDEFHFEILVLDSTIGEQFSDRAHQIILGDGIPKKISESPGWFGCKWCDHKSICHSKKPPERNCRTCAYSVALADGQWYCNEPNRVAFNGNQLFLLSADAQYKGCDSYNRMEVFCR